MNKVRRAQKSRMFLPSPLSEAATLNLVSSRYADSIFHHIHQAMWPGSNGKCSVTQRLAGQTL